MEISPEQQQAMEAQKAQCPFCKIVKGEIPSKKVYEDDLLLGVLDINPAAKGHILLMPKEHYPIMPLIPPETFEHLFAKTKLLSQALKEGVLLFGDTIYIANGFAAGQQSSHFMLHLISREDNDGLDFFSLKTNPVDKTKKAEAFKLLKHNLPIMLRNRYAKYPIEGKEPPAAPGPVPGGVSGSAPGSAPAQGGPTGRQYTKESLIQLVESNPQLKQLITQYPEDFKKQVTENARLKDLFEHVDLDEIIAHFTPKKPTEEEQQEGSEGESEREGSEEEGPKYTIDELVAIVNDNPQLRELLLKQTLQFSQKVREVPKLNKIFGHVDIEELERAVLRKEVREEEDVKDLLGSYAQQLGPAPQRASEEAEEHMNIPDAGSPVLIQEEDPSIAALSEDKSEEEVQEEDSEENDQQQTQQKNTEEKRETKRPKVEQDDAGSNEAEQNEMQGEESDDVVDADLISRLHNEMVRRNV
jgi:histidine triad (HIT) family protein